ncbi:hypothetical protein NDU88_004879 [Pleurodeles waltl]|uniref:Uncharacterized protein n=1 Tax=Pleurodeles waltl TaxID=8319 RepID=A0AAV7VHH1_PLEWA|nr:hypothetical protein NDU88_004879 [Pleurodeles waltl]
MRGKGVPCTALLPSSQTYHKHGQRQKIKIPPCDGPALPDPSVKTACAGAAARNLELEDGVTSPFRFPGLKLARRRARAPENAEKEGRRAGDEEESVEKAGVWGREDGWQKRPPVKSQDTSEGEDVSGTLTAEQEAHREDSSHASGEAWHSQVRP